MEWKDFLFFLFFLAVVVLLIFYWFFPLEDIEFRISGPGHSNFTLNASAKQGMQFYDNMRYPSNEISYRIEKCTLKKTDEMERAFEVLESETVLDFYPVSRGEEILITCDEGARFEGEFFVAGEGGPTKITQSENFNVIHEGGITLIRDSKCEEPLVALHELLHALGFDHSENSENVMYSISRCDQKLGEDIPETINYLYSFPSHADLDFENASALMHGRYLDVSVTIRNQGLQDTEESKLIIYGDGETIREINVDSIPVSGGRIITLTNLLVLQASVEEIELVLDYDFPELDKNNNRLILGVN